MAFLAQDPQIKIPVEMSARVGIPDDILKLFEFRSRIGGGVHGTVYKGIDKLTGEEVAAKLICNFRGGSNVISKLKHPNILPLLRTVVSEEKPSLLVEVYPLCSTFFEMRNGIFIETSLTLANMKVDYESLLSLLRECLDAIVYLNSQGFLHKDIKPENFLIVKEGSTYTALLTDFAASNKPLLGVVGRQGDLKSFILTLLICLEDYFNVYNEMRVTYLLKYNQETILTKTSLKDFIPIDLIKVLIRMYKGKDINYKNIKMIIDLLENNALLTEN